MPSLPNRTRRLSQILSLVSLFALAVLFLTGALLSFQPDHHMAELAQEIGITDMSWTPSRLAVTLWSLSIWVSLAPLFYVFWHMYRLFRAFAGDAALSTQASTAIRGIGAGFLVKALMQVLSHTWEVLFLTMDAPQGQRQLSVAFGLEDLIFALAGGMMLVIGVVLTQAIAIKQENEAFV
ncbi:hypothetical protein TRP8649_00804 [Pelagimonas phthalicica]|uniref:DUF2975 domain-containing protein n=1 Tax=Pelagimonas phthalicica TaxID=1037362 RepID=A0A238J7Z8_9RHOB|nr:DUF2975 domain-containing protein [Pelagimonas phthalicica]TDS94752.1 Protein of unknown function (DUF2975) [Pelagimonas phthalicica]SMX26719.1 hypothetical protein TRP8649_00804 [Pelagimonas phthalicica]